MLEKIMEHLLGVDIGENCPKCNSTNVTTKYAEHSGIRCPGRVCWNCFYSWYKKEDQLGNQQKTL